MTQLNFNQLAEALFLYHEQGNSLFLPGILQEKLKMTPQELSGAVKQQYNVSPEQLIAYLDPEEVKKCIVRTKERFDRRLTKKPQVNIQLMTSEEIGSNGANLQLHFSFATTFCGPILMASTAKGICYIAFSDEEKENALEKLKAKFPQAHFVENQDSFHRAALDFFEKRGEDAAVVPLHLKATPFQAGVWEKLLRVPIGGLLSYSALAGNRKDSHALGNAVGSNPIAYIIPCHRAVRASGVYGEYHWGAKRKAALICLESIS